MKKIKILISLLFIVSVILLSNLMKEKYSEKQKLQKMTLAYFGEDSQNIGLNDSFKKSFDEEFKEDEELRKQFYKKTKLDKQMIYSKTEEEFRDLAQKQRQQYLCFYFLLKKWEINHIIEKTSVLNTIIGDFEDLRYQVTEINFEGMATRYRVQEYESKAIDISDDELYSKHCGE
jgi:hypothetical protein